MSACNLGQKVKELMQEHQKEFTGQFSEQRQKACEEMVTHLKGLLPEKLTADAERGHTETRLLEFKHKDNLKFGGIFAKDLLTKGDVVAQLQKYLDTEHGDGTGEPIFYVYFTHVGRYQENYEETKFGLFVNWDQKRWPEIKSRLTHSTGRDGNGSRGRGVRGGRTHVFSGVGRGRNALSGVTAFSGGTSTKASPMVLPPGGSSFPGGHSSPGTVAPGPPEQHPAASSDELPISHDE
jgi:hypothetical protein